MLWVTRAGYVYPSGSTFNELVEDKVDKATFAQIQDGDRVCLEKEPWTLLYAATFHPSRQYAVREAQEPSDCGDYRLIK